LNRGLMRDQQTSQRDFTMHPQPASEIIDQERRQLLGTLRSGLPPRVPPAFFRGTSRGPSIRHLPFARQVANESRRRDPNGARDTRSCDANAVLVGEV
jgi:hypothetical protein